jgi:hypothetical protein
MDDAWDVVDWRLGSGKGSDWLCALVDCGEVNDV